MADLAQLALQEAEACEDRACRHSTAVEAQVDVPGGLHLQAALIQAAASLRIAAAINRLAAAVAGERREGGTDG